MHENQLNISQIEVGDMGKNHQSHLRHMRMELYMSTEILSMNYQATEYDNHKKTIELQSGGKYKNFMRERKDWHRTKRKVPPFPPLIWLFLA